MLAAAFVPLACGSGVVSAGRTAILGRKTIEIQTEPRQPKAGDATRYNIRVRDYRGQPMHSGILILSGRESDVSSVFVRLARTNAPGVYQGVVVFPAPGPWHMRLVVIAPGEAGQELAFVEDVEP